MHNPRRNCEFIRYFADPASGFDFHTADVSLHIYHNEPSTMAPPPRTSHDILQPRPVLGFPGEPHSSRLNPHDSHDPIPPNYPPPTNYIFYEYSPTSQSGASTPPVLTSHSTPSAPRLPQRLQSLTPLTGFSPNIPAFSGVISSPALRTTEMEEGIHTSPFNRRQRHSTPGNYFDQPISSNGLQLHFCKSFNRVIQSIQLTTLQPRLISPQLQKSLRSPPAWMCSIWMALQANPVRTKGKAPLDQMPSESPAKRDTSLLFWNQTRHAVPSHATDTASPTP